MLARERRGALVQVERRGRGGRVVRVVQPQDRGARPDVGRDGVEVGQEAVRGAQRQLDHLPCRRTPPRARRPGRRAGGRRSGRRRAPGRGGTRPPWSRTSGSPRCPGPAARRSGGRPTPRSPRAARAAPRRSGYLDCGSIASHQRLADERRRLLARLADPEVDHRHAGRRSRARPRSAARTGTSAGRPARGRASRRERLQHACERTSAAISTDSSRRCACAGAPGPKLTASMPAAPNSATGVHACLGATRRSPARDQRARARVAGRDRAGRRQRVDRQLAARAQLAQPRLGLGGRAAGRVAVVDVRVDAVRDHVAGDPARRSGSPTRPRRTTARRTRAPRARGRRARRSRARRRGSRCRRPTAARSARSARGTSRSR